MRSASSAAIQADRGRLNPPEKATVVFIERPFCMPGQQSCMSDDAYDVLFASRLAVTEPNTAWSLHSAAHRGLGRTVAGKAHAKQWSSEALK